jgi:glucose/arabinose dehydrogenase
MQSAFPDAAVSASLGAAAMDGGRRTLIALVLVAVAARGAMAQTIDDPSLRLDPVAGGLSAPTALAFLASGDMLVTQKNDGRVRRVLGGVLQPTPVLDVAVCTTPRRSWPATGC